MNIADTDYSNTDEEGHEICEFLNALSKKDPFLLWESGRMSGWRYDLHANKSPQDQIFRDSSLSPQTKREVHKYAKMVV